MNFLINLKDIDRRIIYVVIALAVALPFLVKFDFPVFPGKNVMTLHSFVDQLKPGERCFLSFDYDLASMPELHPAAVAVLAHMLERGIKPICGANWPLGGDMGESALAKALEITQEKLTKQGKPRTFVKGEDYVNVGYKPGAIVHVKRMVADFLSPFPADKDGNSTSNMKIFQNPDGRKFSMDDIGIIVSFTAGTGGIETFISIAGDHKRPMAAACTSVNIPRFYTYIQTKQLIGMIGGMPGAAEYEKMIDFAGPARLGMVPQSVSHLVIILFIIIGNLAYLAEKSRQAKKSY
jgi:hypothetical protein